MLSSNVQRNTFSSLDVRRQNETFPAIVAMIAGENESYEVNTLQLIFFNSGSRHSATLA